MQPAAPGCCHSREGFSQLHDRQRFEARGEVAMVMRVQMDTKSCAACNTSLQPVFQAGETCAGCECGVLCEAASASLGKASATGGLPRWRAWESSFELTRQLGTQSTARQESSTPASGE